MIRLARVAAFCTVVVCLATLWVWWLWDVPIDCSNSFLNRIFHAAIPLSPAILGAAAAFLFPALKFIWIRFGLVIGGLALSLVPWFFLMWGWRNDTSGADEGQFLIHEVPINGGRLRAYRTNGGATTDYGVIVHRETPIIGPFFRYERIYSEYHQADIEMSLAPDEHSVVIRGECWGYGHGRTIVTVSL